MSVIATLALAACATASASVTAPSVPAPLAVPAGNRVVWKTGARGAQVYKCTARADGFEWVLARPDAELFDEGGHKVGRHFEGPTWEAKDGSRVAGELAAKAPALDTAAVPWLLLRAKSSSGAGLLGKVTFVQRVDTTGGKAPPACAAEEKDTEKRVDYTATYYFYAP
jgi:hypothetical protein